VNARCINTRTLRPSLLNCRVCVCACEFCLSFLLEAISSNRLLIVLIVLLIIH
jgi:hypothetical protein